MLGLFTRKPAKSAKSPIVIGFFEKITSSVQYVVADPETKRCAIIDPVLDFEEKSGSDRHAFGRRDAHPYREQGLQRWSGSSTRIRMPTISRPPRYLKDKTGVPTAIGAKVVEVQKLWKDIYNLPDFPADGSQWDKLFADGERFTIGNCPVEVMFSPGHTLASITYVAGDAAFIHDTLFMPDGGTARADFPGGDAGRAVAQHPAHSRLAAQDAALHGPRLHARAAACRRGRARSPSRRRRTRTCARSRRRPSTSRCARPATRRCRCRTSCCSRCR